MERTFLFILGYHEDYITRRLHLSHASRSDEVALITPYPLTGALKRAYYNIEIHLSKIKLKPPKQIPVPTTNTDKAIEIIAEETRKLPEPIILDLTGGDRLLSTLTLLTLLLTRRQVELYIQPETGEPWEIKIPKQVITLIYNPLSPEKQNILKTITQNPGITIQELAQIHNKTTNTIRIYITQLKRLELVIQKGRKASIYPTKWAKIITKTK